MKYIRASTCCRICALTCLLAVHSAANAGVISINSLPSPATLGSTVAVEVSASGLTDTTSDSISAYDLEIEFDSTVLSFDSIIFGDAALGNQLNFFEDDSPGPSQDVIILAPGILNVFASSGNIASVIDSNQANDFGLFTLGFTADSVTNETTVGFNLSNPFVLDSGFNDLAVQFQPSAASFSVVGMVVPPIATVPEPSIIFLLLAGIPFLRKGRMPSNKLVGDVI